VKTRSPKGGSVEILTSGGDGEEAVKMRLRNLLQLALTIGEREGLLGNRSGINGSVLPKNSRDDQPEEVKLGSRQTHPPTGRRSGDSGLRRGRR
jgi:hypothetical protein